MEKELIVKWKVKAAERERVLALLPEMAEKTQAESGNLFYNVYQSESDPNELILHERYASEEAAAAHKSSEHYLRIVAGQIAPHLEVREVTVVKRLC